MFARWDRMAKQFTRIGKEIAIAVKAGGEHLPLSDGPSPELLWRSYEHWLAELVAAQEKSTLPEHPSAGPGLHDFVVQLRLKT